MNQQKDKKKVKTNYDTLSDEQKKRLNKPTWFGFFFPGIYLIRANSGWFILVLVAIGIGFINSGAGLVAQIVLRIIVLINGRRWSFESSKKTNDNFDFT